MSTRSEATHYGGPVTHYYRLQPAGLGLAGHYSECSDEDPTTHESVIADGLHVFLEAHEAVDPQGMPEAYGDEIVILEAPAEWWDNGDCEGVCVDPSEARIVARFPWALCRQEWIELDRNREAFAEWLEMKRRQS